MATHREIRLRTRPERGLPAPEHLALVRTALSVPAPGEVPVRNRWFAVSAALRTLIGGGVKDAPFPPVEPGDPLVGAAVGEVVSAPDGSGPAPRRPPPGRPADGPHARVTSSSYSALHRSSTASGSSRTRSGRSASIAPSSCVTITIAPG
ncbi:oxidoreductase family protein [Streptomyces sp. PanSC19]|nr:oxidoreductase family protein [Streptomyces sp. PanSC19]